MINAFLSMLDKRFNIGTELAWVPSHDRIVPGWAPHHAYTEHVMRGMNKVADSAATDAMTRSLRNAPRALWHKQKKAAHEWAETALALVCAVGNRYLQCVRCRCGTEDAGVRAGEPEHE